MGRKRKLKRFEELLHFTNVYENFSFEDPTLVRSHEESGLNPAGKWSSYHFGNDQPIVLELACGGGEYTCALAKRHPEINFIGVDIKGARIWKGALKTRELKLTNTAFLRARIEKVETFFGPGEISEIWITFPDPFLRESQVNRRLTSAQFLDRYKKVLKPGGIIHLKTDDPILYSFTLKTLGSYIGANILHHSDDIYAGPLPHPDLDIHTYYEARHLKIGKTIKYVAFTIH